MHITPSKKLNLSDRMKVF